MILALNGTGRGMKELEEAWIVHALVREDGLSQVQVAELLERHKSWVSRRLALLETYRKQDLLAALERPARFGAFSLRSVERILAAQAQPKTPLETLGDQQQRHLREILQDRHVPPRPTADYEPLCPQEPPDDEPPPEAPDPNQPKP